MRPELRIEKSELRDPGAIGYGTWCPWQESADHPRDVELGVLGRRRRRKP
jgi:hypothetical protein